MNVRVFFGLLFKAHSANRPHDDNLRAGEYPDVTFAPWTIALPGMGH